MQEIQTTVQPSMQQAGSKNEKAAQNLSRCRHLCLVSADRPRRNCPVRLTGCCWLLKRWCANSKMTQTQSWPFDIKDINENKCECAFGCLGLFLSSRNERGRALLACLSVIFCSVADDLPVSLHLLLSPCLSPAGCRALAEVSAEGCWDRGGPDPGEERRSGGTASTGMTARSHNVKTSQHTAWTPKGWDSILVCRQENKQFSLNIWRNFDIFAPRPCISVLLCNLSPISFSWFWLSAELRWYSPTESTSNCKIHVKEDSGWSVSPAEQHTGWSLCLIHLLLFSGIKTTWLQFEKVLPLEYVVYLLLRLHYWMEILPTCFRNPVMSLVLSLESWKMRYWPVENILHSDWKWYI